MPSYTFKNTDTGEVFEEFMSISAMEKYLAENQNIIRHHEGTPAIVSGLNAKPAQGFRDILNVVHKRAGRNSKVNTW